MPDMYPEDQLFSSPITRLPQKNEQTTTPTQKTDQIATISPIKVTGASAILEHIPINPH